MKAGFNRRKFIRTSGSLLLLLPLAQYCNNKSKSAKNDPGKPKDKTTVKRVSKRRKQPIVASMVTNRGWYQNKKNYKIHYFDKRGFTPCLLYLKDKKEFDAFVKHLEPWDVKQLTLPVFEKNVSKKSKDWITENAALAFTNAGNYGSAVTIIKNRIEKRPVNTRMWDLLAVITLRSDDAQLKATQQELITKFSNTKDARLKERLTRYINPDWQTKTKDKGLSWDNQKI